MNDSTTFADMQQEVDGVDGSHKPPSTSSVYQNLDSKLQEIRLLHVDGAQNEDDILICTLKTVSLLDHPAYEAVSYCWGEVSGTTTIKLNGRMVEVPSSAAKVLRQFRLHHGHRVLWNDATCIHQQDLTEQSQQVALMGQIYRSAQRTLVWLGDSDDATEQVLCTFRRISDDFYDPIYGSTAGFNDGQVGTESPEKFDKELEDGDVQPALKFYKRPWFSRVWVIQEVVLAKTAICHCGEHTIPWRTICRSTRWLAEFLRRVKKFQDFQSMRGMHLASLGLALEDRPTLPLAVILPSVKPLSCTNARDKFYGIHSMTMLPSLGQGFQDDYGVNIDYTKSIPAVFRDVTRVAILQHCNLQIFSALDDNASFDVDDNHDWPSWVPRWDLDGGTIDLEAARGLPSRQVSLLSGKQQVDRNLALAYAATKGMENCLPLRGFAFDNVVANIATFSATDDQESLNLQDLGKFMSECFKFVNTPTRQHLAKEVVKTIFVIAHLERVFPGTDDRCFQLLRISASILATGRLPADSDDSTIAKYRTFKPWLPEIFTNIGLRCNNMSFFLTDNDIIGVCGPATVADDLVVAFSGATDLYVLRPILLGTTLDSMRESVRERDNVRMRGYSLVGRCFVHGLTNGTEPLPIEAMSGTERIFEVW